MQLMHKCWFLSLYGCQAAFENCNLYAFLHSWTVGACLICFWLETTNKQQIMQHEMLEDRVELNRIQFESESQRNWIELNEMKQKT